MAAVSGAKACSATLSGTTADTITFTKTGSSLFVLNRDPVQTLWVRLNGTAVAGEDENYPVLPMQSVTFEDATFGGSGSYSIVGNGNAYSAGIF